jgi:hypothetical protein
MFKAKIRAVKNNRFLQPQYLNEFSFDFSQLLLLQRLQKHRCGLHQRL